MNLIKKLQELLLLDDYEYKNSKPTIQPGIETNKDQKVYFSQLGIKKYYHEEKSINWIKQRQGIINNK